ncbi:MAG: hypothetical protein AAGF89_11580 [Bacteroidota bacterium]
MPSITWWRRAVAHSWGCLACLLILASSLSAQEEKSPVFPEERYDELRQEVVYEAPEKEEEEAEEIEEPWDIKWDLNLSQEASIFIFVVLLLVFGFLIYRVLGDVEMRKRTRGDGEEEEAINIEDIEEERLVADGVSLSLLQRAENAGQFDIAVRLLYIQLLKELQDAELIKYRRDFSNRDYQGQLSSTSYLNDFRDVTADYERYWFGKYTIDRLSYRLVQRKFNVLSQQIKADTKSEDYV